MEEARVEELWNEIWDLLEEGRSEAAASASLRALGEDDSAPEFHYLLGLALLDLDEVAAAHPELARSVELGGDWAEARSALAWASFRLCRFDQAGTEVDRALALKPGTADAHQLRGLLAEREGDEARALVAFAEARRLDPDRFPDPVHLDEDEFLNVARRAVAELDEAVRHVLEDTAFFVQPFPSSELLEDGDPPLDPQILGLFVGRSLLEQSVQDSGQLPNTMYLFQNNLQRSSLSRDALEEEIRITVLHEIGHHLGWDEEELATRGLA